MRIVHIYISCGGNWENGSIGHYGTYKAEDTSRDFMVEQIRLWLVDQELDEATTITNLTDQEVDEYISEHDMNVYTYYNFKRGVVVDLNGPNEVLFLESVEYI